MATRISPPQNKTYYINPAYLTFNENSGYGANLIQVSASSSCYISVYDPSNGIGYSDADRNYKRWKVTAYNNKFPDGSDNKLFHVYVRLETEGTAALIVYDTQKRGVRGGLIVETTDENGNKVEKEEEVDKENLTYYYIRIGEVSEVKGSLREITYDTGYLTSDEASNDKSGIDEMFELDKYSTPWLIKAKQWLQGWMPGSSNGFIVKGFAKLIGGLAFSKGKDGDEKIVSDIKRSTDSDEKYLLDAEGSPQLDEQGSPILDPAYVPVNDETLPTTKYVESKLDGFDKKYLRKDQDDRTPYALTVGGKSTAEGGIQIGKEFMSGLTGYGANINEEGRAELHSLFIRQFLEVPELRYNRVTVRMGDSITSCAAGVVESVNLLSESEGTLKLKLEEGEMGSLAVDDIVVQIYSDMNNPENNSAETSDDGKGNRFMKGFATVIFRVIDVSGVQNEIITYSLREGYPHPYAMGSFAQRGNFTNPERQTIIYEGIYPKPYTRYMTGVNNWEFSFEMIGMQLGDLGNLSAYGHDLSGYSAYLNNIYYTGFVFELTPQQKAEISAYSVSLSEYVGSVRVDSEGNIIAGEYVPLNVVSGDDNVVTEGQNVVSGEVLLQTRVQAFKGEEELAYVSDIPQRGQFTSVVSASGCTAVISNGVVSITSVENFEYCSVKIETLCEGKTTFYNTYQVKVLKDGSSALVIDLDNENDTIACREDGSYLYGLPVSTRLIASYGEKLMNIKSVELILPQDENGNNLVSATADVSTGKVEVLSVSDNAPDVIQIEIGVTVELFGKDETRSVVFTLGKLKQGESAVLYRLNPSVSVIKKFNNGTLSDSAVSCSVTKYTGKSSEELESLSEGISMSYKVDGVPDIYTYKDDVEITKDNKEVVFTLYVDGVKRDEEIVLVVSDGNAVKEIKEWYLANDDKDTVPSYDDAWTLDIPAISKESKYLWNYEETDYTDPSMEDVRTAPVVIAMWTQDGKGVKEVIEWYQVNNEKDVTPDYPHIDGDEWVSGTAPIMTEEAKYLWNYEEILWTDDSVTYTEPAMIGAKGETGATTPVLSVSYKAVSRNSIGSFDPSTVIVFSKRGVEEEPVWMSAFGIYKDGDIEGYAFLGDSDGKVSRWNVELKTWSESVDSLGITSIKFRSYSERTNNYLQPCIAEDGLTFVRQGEVGENGPMPRNRGQYDGEAEYFYNDEYRDYVWKPNGMVWIRQGRGVTENTDKKGAIKGIEPSNSGDTEYWGMADRMSLTAIDTALIDEANIAGFMFKNGMLVSQENDPRNLKANIIIDGATGKIKCNDAEVKGLITVDNIEYDVQYSSDGSLVQSAMVVGPGEFTLPSINEGYTTEIKAIYPTIESRMALPPFKFGHSQADKDSILFYDNESRWCKYYSEVELEPNILYTFVSYNDSGTYRWMLTTSTGEGSPGNAPIVDSELNINSTNPVQNKVISSEINRIGPIAYDSSKKYWKLDGDLLVTGGVTMYGVDGSSFGTIWNNAPLATSNKDYKGVASFDPNYFSVSNGYVTFIGQTGGGVADSVAWGNVTGKPSWITTTKPEYQYTEIKGTPDLAGYVTLSGNQTITGEKTFESSIKIKRGFSILDDQGWGIVGVNPTEWTGLPTDGSAIGFGTGAAPVYIRTSGDDLYHYDKTNDAAYKIIDSNNIVNYKAGDSIKFNGFSMRTDSSFEDKAVDANINYVIDATSLSTSYFYPIVFPYSPKDLYVRMFSTGGSAAAAYNQNKLEFTFRGQGWTDAPNGLTVHFYSCYDAKETTIGCIAMGEEQGYKVVWVRGGLTYYVTSNITPTLYKDGVTFTNEKYSYGVNFYGGTNTKVKVYWTPQATSGLGAMYHSGSIGTYGSLNVKGISIYKSDKGYLFIDGDLVVKGGITMYGTDGTAAPTIWDNAPIATDNKDYKGVASFDSKFFSVSNGHVTFIGDVGGLDESALASYLSTNKYLTQTTGDARYLAIGGNAVSASGLSGLTPIISAANESNEISAVRNSYGAITTNAPTSGAAITNALKFRWYDTDWQIGNVRNMSNGTSGLGVTYGSSNLRFLVKTDGVETYGTLKTNGVIPASNGSYSLGSSSYKWASVYATSFEGNATSATTASNSNKIYINRASSSNYVPILLSDSSAYSSIGNNSVYSIGDNIFGYNPSTMQLRVGTGIQIRTSGNSESGTIQSLSGGGIVVYCSVASQGIAFMTKNSSGSADNRVIINGDGHLYPAKDDTYNCGRWGNNWKYLYSNNIVSGGASNNLWLVGGNASGVGIKFGLMGTDTTVSNATSIGTWNATGLTVEGGITTHGEFKHPNATRFSIANNAGSYKGVMSMDNGNNFVLGYDTAASSYDTYIDGFNMHFRTGNAHSEIFTLGSTGGAKLYLKTAALIIKRNHSSGGAYTQYQPCNQENRSWSAGVNNSYQYSWWYQNVSSGIDVQKMYLDSSGNLLTTGGITMYSDLRKKTILNHVELSLKEVADAPLIEHYYNSDEAKTTHVGSVAQYWAGLNDWFCKEDGEGFLTMEIQNAALASAISVARELTRYESKTDKQIKKLKKRIGELEEEIENLKNK